MGVLYIIVLTIQINYAQICKSEGDWQTNQGPLTIFKLHNGNIMGQFKDKTIQFEGKENAKVITGIWRVKENNNSQYIDIGQIILNISDNCKSFLANSRLGFDKENNKWAIANITGTKVLIDNNTTSDNSQKHAPAKLVSYTKEVISDSPSQFELNNASILYTGAINTVSPQGQIFADEHAQLAKLSIELVELTGQKLKETRKMNQNLSDLLTMQLELWKSLQDKLPPLKIVYEKEVQIFNINLQYQIKENSLWALAESIEKQIINTKPKLTKPANESLILSNLYTQLMVAYYDIIELYNEKYTYLIPMVMLNHTILYNPNLQMPAEIVQVIEPIHLTEFELIQKILLDSEQNTSSLNAFSEAASGFNDLQNRINLYSINQLESIITTLEEQKQKEIAIVNSINDPDRKSLLQTNTAQLENYIDYYKGIKENLQKTTYSAMFMSDIIKTQKENKKVLVAYNGNITADIFYGGFGYSLWDKVKNGANAVLGAGYAVTDYMSAKVSQAAFEVTEKASVAWDKGLFSKEYAEFSNNYNEIHKKINNVTFINTIAEPLRQTLTGNLEEGLGQSGMRKAKESFSDFEDKIDSLSKGKLTKNQANFVTNIVLNVVTVGGYGLSKDVTIIADQKSTPEEIITSSAGMTLAVVPLLSASNLAKTTSKNAVTLADDLLGTSKNAINKISELTAKNTTLKSAYKKTLEESLENTRTYINLLKDNTIKTNSTAFKQVSINLDKSLTKKAITQELYEQTQKELADTITKNIAYAPIKTLNSTLKAGGNVIKELFIEARNGYKDMVNKSLKEIVQEKGIGVYIGESLLDNTYSTIFSNELNKYLATEFKENTTSLTINTPEINDSSKIIKNTTTDNKTNLTNNFTQNPQGWTYKQNPSVKVTETRYLNGKMTYTNDPKILNKQNPNLSDIGKNLGVKNATPVRNTTASNLKWPFKSVDQELYWEAQNCIGRTRTLCESLFKQQFGFTRQDFKNQQQQKQNLSNIGKGLGVRNNNSPQKNCDPNDIFCLDNLTGPAALSSTGKMVGDKPASGSSPNHNGTWSLSAQGLGPLVISGTSVRDSSNKIIFINTALSGDTLSGYWCYPHSNPCYSTNSRNTFRLILNHDGKVIHGEMHTLVRETISNTWQNFIGNRQ